MLAAIDDMLLYSEHIDAPERLPYQQLLHHIKDGFAGEDIDVLLLHELEDATNNLHRAVRVDFIVLRQTHWGAVRPLVDAFQSLGCDVRIIPVPMLQERQDRWGQAFAEIVENDGYNVTDFRTYHIEDEMPDIVVDNMAVDCAKNPEFRFLRVSSLVDYTVHVEHSILTGYNEAMKRSYFRVGRSRCWQYLVPSPLYEKAFPLIMRIDGSFLSEGCSEMDTVFQSQKRPLEEITDKRTKILWNVDALDPEHDLPGDYARLEKEIKYIQVVATKYPDVISIIRPHPNFRNQEKCALLQRSLDEIVKTHSNVILDTNPLIYDSYRNVHAMVTWVSSTTLFSFAATGKPVIVLPTYIDGGYDTMLDMHLLSVIPIAYSEADIIDFVPKIEADTDKANRIAVFREYTGPINGTASLRIAQEVLARYEKSFS